MPITELINVRDNSEVIRDEIAAILTTETASQQSLATLASLDPDQWKLRVFLERSNPWSEFMESPDTSPPIVNVSLDNISYDRSTSDPVQRQKATGTYHIDCYGYGVSKDVSGGGHTPGDALAAYEAQRAVRLVRNILMAGVYTYLGSHLRGTVWRRWVESVTFFQPSIDGQQVQQVVGARLALQVDFNEFSPQVQGQPIELISAQVMRSGTLEVFLRADYEYGTFWSLNGVPLALNGEPLATE